MVHVRDQISSFTTDLLALRTDVSNLQLAEVRMEQDLDRWCCATQDIRKQQEAFAATLVEGQYSRLSERSGNSLGSHATTSDSDALWQEIEQLKGASEKDARQRAATDARIAAELKLLRDSIDEQGPWSAVLETSLKSELKRLGDRVEKESELRRTSDDVHKKSAEASLAMLRTEINDEVS